MSTAKSKTNKGKSAFVKEDELPQELTAFQSVEIAYPAELSRVQDAMRRGLSVLVECDKELVPYFYRVIRDRLKAAGRGCIYLDGRPDPNAPPNPMAGGFIGTIMGQLRDAVRGAVDDKVVVMPHLDLLTTSTGGLTNEAKEAIPLMYENPNIIWLGFKDPSFEVPKTIKNLFPHRESILGIPRERLKMLVTQQEARKLGQQFNPYALYKYVSGQNAVRLRRLLASITGEDYPSNTDSVYAQIRQATLAGELCVPDMNMDEDIGGYVKVKDRLKNEIVNVMAHKDLADPAEVKRIEDLIPRGMIFWGPPGCLAGSTVVEVNRAGKSFKITMENLVHKFNGGASKRGAGTGTSVFWDSEIPTTIRSRRDDGTIGLVPIAMALDSGVKETFEVKTDSGRTIRATADHPFWTIEGWKKLSELQINNGLYLDGGHTSFGRSKKKIYARRSGLQNHPYAGRKGAAKDAYSVPTHRLVAEATLVNGLGLEEFLTRIRGGNLTGLCFLDPHVYVVHHKNENHMNNSPENLEVMTQEAHFKLHAQEYWVNVAPRTVVEKVVSITPFGMEHTYDLNLAVDPKNANFLANGYVVHNTGKTLFAKAVASALGCAVTVVSGPELKSKWYGESEENLRQIFTKARQAAPSMIIFDELDSFAGRRGMYAGSAGVDHSMVNQLLTEMDGFRKDELVFVVGTTNFVESIDPALLRPGRFEFHLQIPYPDPKDRRAIFDIYNAKFNLNLTDRALEYCVKMSGGYTNDTGTRYSGDHIQALCRSLARNRLRTGATGPTESEDIDRIQAEYADRPELTTDEQIAVATHESGHAICSLFCENSPPIDRITITGDLAGALGYVSYGEAAHKYVTTENQLRDNICMMFGGRQAEHLFYGDVSIGSAHDLEMATGTARALVEQFGMGINPEFRGFKMFCDPKKHGEDPHVSERIRDKIDTEVEAILRFESARALKILTDNKNLLTSLRDLLMEKKSLDRQSFAHLVDGKVPPKKNEKKIEVDAPAVNPDKNTKE
jgi:SpoVK/Ycf46/Vps4 family AAA+-type ATPase